MVLSLCSHYRSCSQVGFIGKRVIFFDEKSEKKDAVKPVQAGESISSRLFETKKTLESVYKKADTNSVLNKLAPDAKKDLQIKVTSWIESTIRNYDKDKNSGIDAAEYEQFKAELEKVVKEEMEYLKRLVEVEQEFKGFETKEAEQESKKVTLDNRFQEYQKLYQDAVEKQKTIPGPRGGAGKSLHAKVKQLAEDTVLRLAYKMQDITLLKKAVGSGILTVDDEGNIDYDPRAFPDEATRAEMMKTTLGLDVDIMDVRDKIVDAQQNLPAYKQAVADYEKQPSIANKERVMALAPQLPDLKFPSASERHRVGLTKVQPFLDGLYAEMELLGQEYGTVRKEYRDAEEKFLQLEQRVNDSGAEEILKGVEDGWKTVEISLNNYRAFQEGGAMAELLALKQTPVELLDEDAKNDMQTNETAFNNLSEEAVRGLLMTKRLLVDVANRNVSPEIKAKILKKLDEVEKLLAMLKTDRLKLKSVESFKRINDPQGKEQGSKNDLYAYVIWEPKDGKSYQINEGLLSNLLPAQRNLIRSQIELMLATHEEEIDTDLQKSFQDMQKQDPEKLKAKILTAYGPEAQAYLDALAILEQGDLKTGAAKLRQFITHYETLPAAEKEKLKPLIIEARNQLQVICKRQVQILQMLSSDIADIRLQENANGISPTMVNDPIRLEMSAIATELQNLRIKVEKGEVIDVDAELEKIKAKLADVKQKPSTLEKTVQVAGVTAGAPGIVLQPKSAAEGSALQKLDQLYAEYCNLESDDPVKKEKARKAFVAFAKEARDVRRYETAQKYLRIVMNKDTQKAKEKSERKGLSLIEIKKAIIASPEAMAVIRKLAKEYRDKMVGENPALAQHTTLQQLEQMILQRKAAEVHQKELYTFMQYDDEFKDDPALQQYLSWFPPEKAQWWEVWNYSAQEFDALCDEVKLQLLITIVTLPVGFAGGAVGRAVGGAVVRSLGRKVLTEAALEASTQVVEHGSIWALRAGSAPVRALAPAMQEALVGQRGTAFLVQGAGKVAGGAIEKTIVFRTNDLINYGFTGQKPAHLLDASDPSYQSFGMHFVQEALKGKVYEVSGRLSGKLVGSSMGTTSVGGVVAVEVLTGASSTGLEGTFAVIEGREYSAQDAVKSLLLNAVQSASSHAGRGVFEPKEQRTSSEKGETRGKLEPLSRSKPLPHEEPDSSMAPTLPRKNAVPDGEPDVSSTAPTVKKDHVDPVDSSEELTVPNPTLKKSNDNEPDSESRPTVVDAPDSSSAPTVKAKVVPQEILASPVGGGTTPMKINKGRQDTPNQKTVPLKRGGGKTLVSPVAQPHQVVVAPPSARDNGPVSGYEKTAPYSEIPSSVDVFRKKYDTEDPASKPQIIHNAIEDFNSGSMTLADTVDCMKHAVDQNPRQIVNILDSLINSKLPPNKTTDLVTSLVNHNPYLAQTIIAYKGAGNPLELTNYVPLVTHVVATGGNELGNMGKIEVIKEPLQQGKIPYTPEVVEAVLSYPGGQKMMHDLIREGGCKEAAPIKEMIKRSAGDDLDSLAITIQDSQSLPPEIKSDVEKTLQKRQQALNDGALLHALYDPSEAKSFYDDVKSGLEGESTPVTALLTKLKARDPEAHNVLLANKYNLSKLGPNTLRNIVEGNAFEFKDTNGKTIKAYKAKDAPMGEGGLGKIHEVYYTKPDTNQLVRGVLKMPKYDSANPVQSAIAKKAFEQERQGALEVQSWKNDPDSQYINKAVSVGPNYIVYETGQNPRSLENYFKTASAVNSIDALQKVIKALGVFHRNNRAHVDIKPENIPVFDSDNGPVVQVIDNTPREPGLAVDPNKIPFTPDFYPDITDKSRYPIDPRLNPQGMYATIDTFSLGVMLSDNSGSMTPVVVDMNDNLTPERKANLKKPYEEHTGKYLRFKLTVDQAKELKQIATDLKNPAKSSQPGFLEDVNRRLENIKQQIITQNSAPDTVKPGPNPVDVQSQQGGDTSELPHAILNPKVGGGTMPLDAPIPQGGTKVIPKGPLGTVKMPTDKKEKAPSPKATVPLKPAA